MIKSIRSKPLKQFASTGDSSKLPVQGNASIAKLTRQMQVLDAAVQPDDMNLPGWRFHGLQGAPKRYSVSVTANFRLTYGWEEADAVDVDLEDYH
ncbi:type II toxin-antitoxin system RelE/ParE family toxin [Altererythrobacter sp. Z27]|uniref:type II toxin-antitoxin system RelE/ParE family toxin n=1 Tax=Altererythrobacter sp. Z27 TaxID=3461147 RepID=UPI004043B097